MHGFCPLASGSKGNSIFLGTTQTKILIDAGLSAKSTVNRLAEIGVQPEELQAILISHEHTDHIAGVKVLASRYHIPLIANRETATALVREFHECPQFKIFTTGEPFEFGDLEIHPFSIQHDASDPVAFTIRTANEKIGVCTDLGFATSLVQHALRDCNILYLEANHKPSMVHACSRPTSYKERVLGPSGHLSNEACGTLLTHLAHNNLRQVYLAHLSRECNTPQVALETVGTILEQQGITLPLAIAHQDTRSIATLFA